MDITKDNLLADQQNVVEQIAKLSGALGYIDQLIAYANKEPQEPTNATEEINQQASNEAEHQNGSDGGQTS